MWPRLPPAPWALAGAFQTSVGRKRSPVCCPLWDPSCSSLPRTTSLKCPWWRPIPRLTAVDIRASVVSSWAPSHRSKRSSCFVVPLPPGGGGPSNPAPRGACWVHGARHSSHPECSGRMPPSGQYRLRAQTVLPHLGLSAAQCGHRRECISTVMTPPCYTNKGVASMQSMPCEPGDRQGYGNAFCTSSTFSEKSIQFHYLIFQLLCTGEMIGNKSPPKKKN